MNFPLDFGTTGSATVTLRETQHTGYSLVTQDGLNARCVAKSPADPDGSALPLENTGTNEEPGFTFTMQANQSVSCTVYNRAPAGQASLTVNKTWNVNGVTYDDGDQPPGIQAQLFATGPGDADASPLGWGVTRNGYSAPDDTGTGDNDVASIGEALTFGGRDLCTLDSATIDSVNGQPTTTTMPSAPWSAGEAPEPPGGLEAIPLEQGENTVHVTNTLTCTAALSLAKAVQGGDADPAGWTLTAYAPQGDGTVAFSGAAGSPAVTSQPVTPGVVYQLAESGGDPRYAQIDARTSLETYPLSTGSMPCVIVDETGTPTSGVMDGINGGVNVPLGQRVRCTATNQTATLDLRKVVDNEHGGTAVPSDWTLTATPVATPGHPVPDGLEPVTVTGSDAERGVSALVRPGVRYDLTESQPPDAPTGYRLASLECEAQDRGVTNVTVDPLDEQLCTFTNVYDEAHWSVSKTADPASGSTVEPGGTITYTLTATNTSGGTIVPRAVTVVDDLAKVLNHATFDTSSLTASAGNASLSGTTLTWSIPTLEDTATLTYSVRVAAGAQGVTLTNLATSDGADPCPEDDPDCRTTTHDVPASTPTPTPSPSTSTPGTPGQDTPGPTAPGGGSPSGAGGDSGGSGGSGNLATTGADVARVAALAALALLVGSALVLVRRRRAQ